MSSGRDIVSSAPSIVSQSRATLTVPPSRRYCHDQEARRVARARRRSDGNNRCRGCRRGFSVGLLALVQAAVVDVLWRDAESKLEVQANTSYDRETTRTSSCQRSSPAKFPSPRSAAPPPPPPQALALGSSTPASTIASPWLPSPPFQRSQRTLPFRRSQLGSHCCSTFRARERSLQLLLLQIRRSR